jgi:hypothetical protein
MDHHMLDRPPADQDMAIIAIFGNDRLGFGGMGAEDSFQLVKRQMTRTTPGIDFLQGYDIRIVALNETDDAVQIIGAILADARMDVPCGDAKWSVIGINHLK